MDKKLTPELKKMKDEYDFLQKRISDLIQEKAILFYGRKAVLTSERDTLDEQIDNYSDNVSILLEKVRDEVSRANSMAAEKREPLQCKAKQKPDVAPIKLVLHPRTDFCTQMHPM